MKRLLKSIQKHRPSSSQQQQHSHRTLNGHPKTTNTSVQNPTTSHPKSTVNIDHHQNHHVGDNAFDDDDDDDDDVYYATTTTTHPEYNNDHDDTAQLPDMNISSSSSKIPQFLPESNIVAEMERYYNNNTNNNDNNPTNNNHNMNKKNHLPKQSIPSSSSNPSSNLSSSSILASPPHRNSTTTTTTEETRDLVKQFIADIWNRGALDRIPMICSPSIRFNGNTGFDRVGHDGLARMVITIRNALEEYHCEIHSMVVEHNKAFCRLRFTGKHVGSLLGIAPTYQNVAWMGATEFTIQQHKILKVWELGDVKSLEEQLFAHSSITGGSNTNTTTTATDEERHYPFEDHQSRTDSNHHKDGTTTMTTVVPSSQQYNDDEMTEVE